MQKILLTLVASFMMLSASASHILGGWMYVICDDDTTTSDYEYTAVLLLVRDLSGINLPTTTTIDINNHTGTYSSTATASQATVLSFPNALRPYAVHVFTATITLPQNDLYHVSWELCCRPPGIANLGTSSSWPIHLKARVNTNNGCNGTPVFLAPPLTGWPSNTPWTNSFAAYDFEMDSLHYVLDTPRASGNATIPVYTVPPASAGGAMTLDGGTGVMSYTASNTGLYQIAVQVMAYDANGMSGLIRADVNLGVSAPGGGNLISVTPPSTVVNGMQSFVIGAPDTTVIRGAGADPTTASIYIPPYIDANSVYIDTNAYKSGANVDVAFSWNPSAADVGMSFPVVIRFESDGWAHDYSFEAVAEQSSVGLTEQPEVNIALYPNPVQEQFLVQFDVPMKTIELFTSTGEVLEQVVPSAADRKAEFAAPRAAGVYFVRLIDEKGGAHSKSFIVE